MKIIKQLLLDKIYNYYPKGISPIDDEYETTKEFKTLEIKICNKENDFFWRLILNELLNLYKSQIQDISIFNDANPSIVNINNPSYILRFNSCIISKCRIEAIFYLSNIEELYCFSVKKMLHKTFDEAQDFINKDFPQFQHLNKFQKHKILNEELSKWVTIKDDLMWNNSFLEVQNEINIIRDIIEKKSRYKLLDEAFLFEIVPNIATLNNPRLNTTTFFNCLFGSTFE